MFRTGELCAWCHTIVTEAAACTAGPVTSEGQAVPPAAPRTIAAGVAPTGDGPPPVPTTPAAPIAGPVPTPATPCPAPSAAARGISSAQAPSGTGPALSLFDPPAARLTDPDTSHEAAASVTDVQRRKVYRAVLEALVEHGPSTDHDLARYVSGKLGHPIGQTSVGVRRGELRDSGLVENSGHKGRTPTGAKAIRWALTPAGIDAVAVAA